MSSKSTILKLSNISKSYNQGEQERFVLDDACLTIYEGEIIAIVGRSGSGKSTLLNMMSGIDQPDSGEVYVTHQIINQLSEYERTLYRRKNMGFVFQFFNLIPTLTIRENILLPLELNNSLNAESIDYVDTLLSSVGLSDRFHHYPDQLSGGEQQRIAILRAIVHKPKLVFADEPTGNLDAETGIDVLKILQNIVQEFKTTLVTVTHSQDVAKIADRAFSMQQGKLIQQ